MEVPRATHLAVADHEALDCDVPAGNLQHAVGLLAIENRHSRVGRAECDTVRDQELRTGLVNSVGQHYQSIWVVRDDRLQVVGGADVNSHDDLGAAAARVMNPVVGGDLFTRKEVVHIFVFGPGQVAAQQHCKAPALRLLVCLDRRRVRPGGGAVDDDGRGVWPITGNLGIVGGYRSGWDGTLLDHQDTLRVESIDRLMGSGKLLVFWVGLSGAVRTQRRRM